MGKHPDYIVGQIIEHAAKNKETAKIAVSPREALAQV
jgi:hypothetical protein